MGAEQFDHVAYGKTAKAAFKSAVEEAAYDYGHAGYTGTIAEKDSFVMIGEVESREEAFKLMDEAFEPTSKHFPKIDDKWGPAGCIKFKDKEGKTAFLFFGWASS